MYISTYSMLVECEGALEVLEAELADIELRQVGVVRRVGAWVPRLDLVRSKLYHFEVIVHRRLGDNCQLSSFSWLMLLLL